METTGTTAAAPTDGARDGEVGCNAAAGAWKAGGPIGGEFWL
jgi:hypothetical protein